MICTSRSSIMAISRRSIFSSMPIPDLTRSSASSLAFLISSSRFMSCSVFLSLVTAGWAHPVGLSARAQVGPRRVLGGQQRRIGLTCNSSAHPPNSLHASGHALGFAFGPIAAVSGCSTDAQKAGLLDHLVRTCEQRWRHFEAERLRSPQVDHQLVFCRRLH